MREAERQLSGRACGWRVRKVRRGSGTIPWGRLVDILVEGVREYWVDQKFHLGFSITSYRKTQTNILANPINARYKSPKVHKGIT